MALANLPELERGSRYCEAGNRDQVAQSRIQALLEMEIAPPNRKAKEGCRD